MGVFPVQVILVPLRVLVILMCSIVVLLLVAGCTYNIQKADGSWNTSFSTDKVTITGGGTNVGGTSGGTSGGSTSRTGNSQGADIQFMKTYFSVDCSRTIITEEPDHTDIWVAKLTGDAAPVMVPRNWDMEPYISSPQNYESGPEGEAEPHLHAEWVRNCKKYPCIPCHFVYDGPRGIGVMIQHDPKDASYDWTAFLAARDPIHASLSDGQLDQYTTNQKPACPITDTHFMTMSLYQQSAGCLDAQYTPPVGYAKSFSFGDGSLITYTSNDPKASLTSTAAFHISR